VKHSSRNEMPFHRSSIMSWDSYEMLL
jgi:hypothetical protein